jgi:chromosome partitioning protein
VADEVQAAKLARDFEHVVIDTGQRPKRVDLKALAEGCDLIIVPVVPATLDTEGMVLTLQELNAIGTTKYKVLPRFRRLQKQRDGFCERSLRLKECRCSRRRFRA